MVEPEPEPVVEKTAPIAADPTPTIADPVAQTLRIGPPQFRPFVVHAPPIVFAPKEDTTSVPPRESPAGETPPAESVAPVPPPVAMQPPVAESRPEFPKETIAEHLPLSPESLLEKPAAPSPELPPFESASPPLLDGKVREFFQSDAPLPLPRVCQILAALPGIHGCILVTRAAESQSGELPAGLDPAVIRDLSQRMRGALADRAETFRVGEVQHLTLHAEQYSLSFFTRGEACACAIHRARIFLPGVSERFAAVAEELARASH